MQPRRDEQTLVSTIDLAPTILAVCGLSMTKEMHGINLLDVAAGKSLNRAWKLLTASVGALWDKIGAALAPSMEKLIVLATDIVGAFLAAATVSVVGAGANENPTSF